MAVQQRLIHRLTAKRREDDTASLNKHGWPEQEAETQPYDDTPCLLTNIDASTALSIDAQIAVYEHILFTHTDTELLPGDVVEIVGVDGSTSVLPPASRTVIKGVVNQFERHYEYAAQSYRKIGGAL